MLHIANSTVQVEKPDKMAFHQGQQCLKYQYMMTQTERKCDNSCWTGDNKCVPISKAREDPGFLERGFKFIKGAGGVRFVNFT